MKIKPNEGRRRLLKALVVGPTTVTVLKAANTVEKGFHDSGFYNDKPLEAKPVSDCEIWDARVFSTYAIFGPITWARQEG